MTDPTPTLRLWLLDWHGQMLDHDPVRDAPRRSPFQSGRLPGLSVVVPVPFHLPCRPFMEKRVSMPRPFPEMEMQEKAKNQIVFFIPKTGTYLRNAPGGPDGVDYFAPAPKNWETFFPLTLEMLRGLSLIMTADSVKLEDDTQHSLPIPTIQTGFLLRFGDRTLPLFLNTAALNQIGRLMPGSAAEVSLQWQADTPPVPFVAHRQAETDPAIP